MILMTAKPVNTHPYATKPWKEQRGQHLKPACEWCGSVDKLCIHHLGHGRKDWKALRHKVATALFLASLDHEHDPTEPDATMTAFTTWKRTHGAEIEKAFQEAKAQRMKHYVSMKAALRYVGGVTGTSIKGVSCARSAGSGIMVGNTIAAIPALSMSILNCGNGSKKRGRQRNHDYYARNGRRTQRIIKGGARGVPCGFTETNFIQNLTTVELSPLTRSVDKRRGLL